MRLRFAALALALLAGLLWVVGPARADAPPQPELRRAEPWLTLVAQPRFTLRLTSSRDLCTAGTLTEISWSISGGFAPYALSIEDSAVDVSAENIRINCGALTETEAADAEAALAAKTITATVTDSRGVRRQAALEVARARALPAPELTDITSTGHRTMGVAYWNEPATAPADLDPAHYVVRWRAAGSDAWLYDESVRELPSLQWIWSVTDLREGTSYELAIAAMRDSTERLTPEALRWSGDVSFRTVGPPQNVVATSTHSTITVTWDSQPGDVMYAPFVTGPHGSKDPSHESANNSAHRAVFEGLQPDTEYEILIPVLMTEGQEVGTSTTIRTEAAPTGWNPLATGPQNLRATATHDSINVTWDRPFSGDSSDYIVYLFETEYSLRRRLEYVYPPDSQITFTDLEPDTAYRVVVVHNSIVRAQDETSLVTSGPPAVNDEAVESDAISDLNPPPPPPWPPPYSFVWP